MVWNEKRGQRTENTKMRFFIFLKSKYYIYTGAMIPLLHIPLRSYSAVNVPFTTITIFQASNFSIFPLISVFVNITSLSCDYDVIAYHLTDLPEEGRRGREKVDRAFLDV